MQETDMAAACVGDPEALERLLLECYDDLLAFLGPRMPRRFAGVLDAEDILQEAYAEAFRCVQGCQFESTAAFSAWLRRIAENRLLDAMRALDRQKRGGAALRMDVDATLASGSAIGLLEELAADSGTPSRFASEREAVEALVESLDKIPQECAEALRLRCLEGLSEDEVARQLGRTPDAVRGLCYRGKQRLREVMGRTSRYFDRR